MRWTVDIVQRSGENNFSAAYRGKVGSCMDGGTSTAWPSGMGSAKVEVEVEVEAGKS